MYGVLTGDELYCLKDELLRLSNRLVKSVFHAANNLNLICFGSTAGNKAKIYIKKNIWCILSFTIMNNSY